MTDRHKRELRYLGLCWCIATSLGALLGGIIGIVQWADAE